MDVDYSAWLGEYWPWLVGAVIIVVGHAWLYGVNERSWSPFNPALILAIVVVLAIELAREWLGGEA